MVWECSPWGEQGQGEQEPGGLASRLDPCGPLAPRPGMRWRRVSEPTFCCGSNRWGSFPLGGQECEGIQGPCFHGASEETA